MDQSALVADGILEVGRVSEIFARWTIPSEKDVQVESCYRCLGTQLEPSLD